MKIFYVIFVNILVFLFSVFSIDVSLYYINYFKLVNNLSYIKKSVSQSNGITYSLKEYLNELNIRIVSDEEYKSNGDLFYFTITCSYELILNKNEKYISLSTVVLLGY